MWEREGTASLLSAPLSWRHWKHTFCGRRSSHTPHLQFMYTFSLVSAGLSHRHSHWWSRLRYPTRCCLLLRVPRLALVSGRRQSLSSGRHSLVPEEPELYANVCIQLALADSTVICGTGSWETCSVRGTKTELEPALPCIIW